MNRTRTEAAAETIVAYYRLGRVEPVDTALVENLCQLAVTIDAMEPNHANYPKLIGAYDRAEAALHKRLSAHDVPDTDLTLDQLLAPVRDEAH